MPINMEVAYKVLRIRAIHTKEKSGIVIRRTSWKREGRAVLDSKRWVLLNG